jgi:hypothetical protein
MSSMRMFLVLVQWRMCIVHFVIEDICRMVVDDHSGTSFCGMAHNSEIDAAGEGLCVNVIDLQSPCQVTIF